MDEVERIARGLTEAQREAIVHAENDGQLGLRFIRFYHSSHRTRRALVRRQLAFTVWSGVVLTPLGLAVRKHLETSHG